MQTDNNPSITITEQSRDAEYVATFLTPRPFSDQLRNPHEYAIDPNIEHKIKRIISYGDVYGCTVRSYINNVLAEHFKQHEDVIKKRL